MKNGRKLIQTEVTGLYRMQTKLILVGIALALQLLTSCTKESSVEWHMVDVNFHKGLQGDAHIIIDDGEVALIDAGYSGLIGDSLVDYFNQLEITKIDKFIISHPHRDHYAGIRNLIKAGITVDSVYYNSNISVNDCCFNKDDFFEVLEILTDQGAIIQDVQESQVIALGRTSFKVISAVKTPSVDGRKIDLNDASVVMRWEVFNHSVLFSGDLNSVVGGSLAKNYPSRISADILKVPHHGASGIAPTEFFEAVSPGLLMFPDPDWVSGSPRGSIAFGYASKESVKSCNNSKNGSVKLVFEKDLVMVKPTKSTPSCEKGIIIDKR